MLSEEARPLGKQHPILRNRPTFTLIFNADPAYSMGLGGLYCVARVRAWVRAHAREADRSSRRLVEAGARPQRPVDLGQRIDWARRPRQAVGRADLRLAEANQGQAAPADYAMTATKRIGETGIRVATRRKSMATLASMASK